MQTVKITDTTTATHRELEIMTGGPINSIFVENSMTGQEAYCADGLSDESLKTELEDAINRVFEIAGKINANGEALAA